MGFDQNKDGKEENAASETKATLPTTCTGQDDASDSGERLSRQPSEASCYATEEEEEAQIQLGPKWSIKQHLEKDKDDESLRRPDIVLQIPESGNPKGLWFTLKEGSHYRLRFSIKVSNDIVCGLRYTNTIWKTVDSSKEMLGTFSPQAEPYTHEMPEETTPSGLFARGSYSARTKFVDDDNKCYLEMNYTFDIQKEWPSK
ncbi:hypothetical protein RJ640_004790 [Escallonia rubra]|uniref:Rho GDP-dissociation inhibitor 1 n=1 Tax=Escallonia rubra TaxID=112253 RepID=A0AA88RCS8_9ASTE|nr:hypothetical protein RJ640_004790 [Escallonia rubra]